MKPIDPFDIKNAVIAGQLEVFVKNGNILIRDTQTKEAAKIGEGAMIDEKKLIEEFTKWRDAFDDKEDNMYILMQSVIEEIQSQPPADQWIPCSSGVLPTERGTYWVTEDWGDGNTALVRYNPKLHGAFEDHMEYYGMDITAWMPAILPEPYKGVE